MNQKKRMFVSIIWVLLGGSLLVGYYAGVLDSFWHGMGVGLIAAGGLQLLRQIRYRTNREYREYCDTELRDERNRFIGGKAWAWAGYLFVLIAATATVVFKLLGREDLMMMASGSVCLLLVLYWGSYVILKKKY